MTVPTENAFKPGERAWLPDGRRVQILAIAPDGYVVQPGRLYTYGEDEAIEEYEGYEMAKRVLRVAPVDMYDASVAAKQEELSRLSALVAKVRHDLSVAQGEAARQQQDAKAALARCQQYEPLKDIADYLDGKITHVVCVTKSSVHIKELAESSAYTGDTVLSLVQDSRGGFKWRSAGNNATPTTSREAALAVAAEGIRTRFAGSKAYADGDFDEMVRAAVALGVTVPEEVIEERRKQRHNELRVRVRQSERRLADERAKLAALEASASAISAPQKGSTP